MKPHDHPLSSSSSSASSVLKRPRQLSHYLFSLLAFIVFVTILYSEDFMCIFSKQLKLGPDSDRVISGTDLVLGIEKESEKIPVAIGETEEGIEKEKEKEIPFAIVKIEEKEKEKEKEKISNAIPKTEEWIEKEEKEKIPSATEKTHEERIEKKKDKKEKIPFAIGKTKESCDIFSGRWVWDEYSRPLYQESDCPYIQPQLTCLEHGRPDRNYQHWRWQPHGCDLPKFNATMMLETLRGKRMMFVGDSLNRGQFQSMVCLLQSVIPEHAKSMETIDSSIVFKAKEYNATIEFYWAPFLLESNTDNAIVHRFSDRIVRKGSINKHGKHWKGADIIVFNTYLWWMTGYKMNISRRPLNDKVKDIIELSTDDAYRMAMKSMLRWAQINMNPKKTRVFFTSMSPLHDKSIGWGGKPGGNCYNETSIIEDPNYWGSDRKSIMQVLGQVFSKSKYPVTFLNITQLSNYRKDAHTSIYKKQWNPLTPEQIANPVSYADCVHWCLPGLQDTWNELLFAKLFYP